VSPVLLERLVTGRWAAVRFAAPLVGVAYLLTAGNSAATGRDWAFAMTAGVLTVFGARAPVMVAVAQAVVLAGAEVWAVAPPVPVKILASVALFEVAVRRPLRLALASAAALAAVYVWFLGINDASLDLLAHRITFVVVAPLLMGALLRSVAETIRQSRAAAKAAEEGRLEGERAARLAERTDIAREVHDLVAHHVASIALRTAVAREVISDLDPRVVTVLDEVHDAATVALGDLRELVALLRDPTAVAQPGELLAQGMVDPADLPVLVWSVIERTSAAGLTIEGAVDPAVAQVDAVRALTVLRTVQEGLTNVTKHAGAGARVVAEVAVRSGAVHVLVADDGGAHPAPAPGSPLPRPPSGHGLTGLAERVGLFGGTVFAGPDGSGWRLAVELPLDGDPPNDAFPHAPAEPGTRSSPLVTTAPR
jgi:signal transduction histidine kinase